MIGIFRNLKNKGTTGKQDGNNGRPYQDIDHCTAKITGRSRNKRCRKVGKNSNQQYDDCFDTERLDTEFNP